MDLRYAISRGAKILSLIPSAESQATGLGVPLLRLRLESSTPLGPLGRLVSRAEWFYLFLLCISVIFLHVSGAFPYKMMDAFS